MSHESGLFVVPEHLMYINIADRTSRPARDIGEARIVNTLFGKAKVRVIREQDKKRKVWLLALLIMVFLLVAGWNGWIALQSSELNQPDESLAVSKGKILVSEPAYLPAFKDTKARSQSFYRRSKTLIQAEIDSLVTRKREAPPLPATAVTSQAAVKPATAKSEIPKSVIASKPNATSTATINKSAVIPSSNSQTSRAMVQAQPAITAASAPTNTQTIAKTVVPPTTIKPSIPHPTVVPASPTTAKESGVTASNSNDSPASAVVKTSP